MKISLFLLIFITALLVCQAESSILAPLTKQLSSWMKWKISATSVPQTDVSVVQFENGYFVETVVEGNKLGVVPHAIRVSPDGELFAVDAINSNIVRITPPLSQYSRARLVAGSFEGYSGHVDGKPSDARFNHPKGVTMDDKGNVYVADTLNMAIRKIGDAGVTTIAGGKSNIPGYRDGPSEDAKFSSDFDVIYVSSTCSLLVVDRGNAALRQISLHQEDCDHNYSSISSSDFILVIGAVLVGYASGLLQHGPFLSFTKNQTDKIKEIQNQPNEEKAPLLVEMLKEDPDAGWPSFGTLILDLLKFSFEALCAFFFNLLPRSLRPSSSNKNLTPLKDHLIMPEDKPEPPLVHKQRVSAPLNETFHAPNSSSSYAEQKIMQNKTSLFKDTSVSSKHRSSKRTDYAAFYGSSENQYSQPTSKVMKDKTRHRYRDKSGEAVLGGGVTRMEAKPAEIKPVDYSDPKFDHYNIRSKYSDDGVFRY